MASPGMMNRRVTLIKPAPEILNDVGELVPDGDPMRYPIWASWKESAGGERLTSEQEFGADTITLEFWWNNAFRDINVEWELEDESGNSLDIVSVTEKGGRRWQLAVKAVRRI